MRLRVVTYLMVLHAVVPGAASAAEGFWPFSIYADQVGDAVAPLNGVNCGPGHVAGPGNVASQYREMGIGYVRMHDFYGPGDLSVIFPGYWAADTSDLSNYDFTETDAVVQGIAAAGCVAMFRFGQSWNNASAIHYIPPPKHHTAAQVCTQIAAHYGGSSSRTIRWWEIWNEPDTRRFWWPESTVGPDGRVFDPDYHFFNLYTTIVKHLKSRWPQIVVGGPGTSGGTASDMTQYARKFLRGIRRLGAPLDFYSWHSYNREHKGPYVFAEQAQAIRKVLKEEGFGKAISILGEWSVANAEHSPDEWKAQLHNMDGAAFTAAALIYLHLYSDVRYAFRYRGDVHGGEAGYGLVNPNGTIKKPGYAFKAYSQLFSDIGPWRMLRTTAIKHEGAALLAVTNSARNRYNILVSLWKCNRDVHLHLRNLPAGWRQPRIRHYRVDRSHDWAEVRDEPLNVRQGYAFVECQAPDGPSCIHLVQVYDAAALPLPVTSLTPKPPSPPTPTVRPRARSRPR